MGIETEEEREMKHKHHDKIVAKASNTGLVQLIKMDGEWENAGLSDKFISFSEEYDYFLCLHQHEEACLHWLGGGDVQMAHKGEFYNVSSVSLRCVDGWNDRCAFMDDSFELRAKPKKEKRWIATLNGWNASQKVFASKQEAVDLLGANSYQFHEIEVEV